MVVENGLGEHDTLTQDGKVHDYYRIKYIPILFFLKNYQNFKTQDGDDPSDTGSNIGTILL